ncbi:MAG: hypothetical protein WKF37_24230 [Bryobacteraceae bacterium]
MPELNDEFARDLGDYQNLEEPREMTATLPAQKRNMLRKWMPKTSWWKRS